ncbi:MAG: amidase domain-containing protein [Oscillospiraceae bacterium]
MRELVYNREKAVEYARKWAHGRNPAYLDFEQLGGDCTNFASQCIFAGAGVMNYTPTFGWYYNSAYDRTPSWTGVQYLYNFLVTNKGAGPYAAQTESRFVQPGDIVQLGSKTGGFYHSPVVIAADGDQIYVAAHTFDTFMRPLSSYIYEKARFLHIIGVRSN